MLVRVVAPHFCAGIILENDVVVRAAPILNWAVGRRREWLRSYFASRGWDASIIEEAA